jgi:5'(3')-deoxyribonucleotidase
MAKKIFFDMDGTIADLYNEENWLPRLLSESKGLFRNLKPMHDKDKLTKIFNDLVELGFEIEVITWTPKDVSQDYIAIVEKEKKEWIQEHFPIIKNVHCLNYGVPKQKAKYKKAKLEILVDDNLEVVEMWNTPKQRKSIIANHNLITNLQALY